MDRDIWKGESGRAKRLSTIAEHSEADNDHRPPCNEEEKEEEGKSSIARGEPERTLEDQAAAVEYFLVDDSPMAKFSRSIKWIYKKVSLESSSSVKSGGVSPFFHSLLTCCSVSRFSSITFSRVFFREDTSVTQRRERKERRWFRRWNDLASNSTGGRCALRERTVNGKRGIIIFRERVTLTFLSAERFDCIL